jgi:acetylornithine deacetylase/succinyl-diaminopimelate desuccinylase-like protein
MNPTPNWQALNDECVRHLQNLIRLDTSNPPGNEIIAARYIERELDALGISCEIVESEPARANLRAVLPGDGREQPLLLMSHLDVVPVEPAFWSHGPFSGDVEGGYVWGRGAVDMKQWTAWHLTTFLDLARTRAPLKRDLVLLATADEEDGSYKGIGWVAEHMPHWLDAEYGLGEGGGGEMGVNGRTFFPCRVGEKGVCRFHLRAHGSPGHGSRPHRDNAIVKLGAALERIGNKGLPLQPTEMVRGMLDEVFGDSSEGRRTVEALLDPATFEEALESSPLSPSMKVTLGAQLHNTATPTILHPTGSRINVIPSTAQADLDGRILPGTTVESFVAELRDLVGEHGLEIEVYEYWPGTASRFDTEAFRVLQDVTREVAGATLVPFLTTGASDGRFAELEPFNVQVYGFGLMRYEPGAAPSDLAHAHNERISLSNLDLGLRSMYEAVVRIAT